MGTWSRAAMALWVLPVAAGCAAGGPSSPAGPAGWSVVQPHAAVGNPLRTASIPGHAEAGGAAQPAVLAVDCRADPDISTMVVRFELPMALGFDFDPFEGPEGIGQDEPLASVALSGGAAEPRYVNGWLSDIDTFVFAYMPDPSEVAGWIAAPGAELGFTVADPEGDGPTLSARYRLPSDPSGLEEVATPCLG